MSSLINVSIAYHWLSTTTSCMNLYTQLVQAAPSLDHPALQLPGIDLDQAKSLSQRGVSGEGWQRKVIENPEIASLVGVEGIRVAKEIPRIHLADAKFEGEYFRHLVYDASVKCVMAETTVSRLVVEGENSVTVGAISQFSYTVYLTADEPSAQTVQASRKNQDIKEQADKDVVFAHAPCWPGVSHTATSLH
jgi:preprotein translocase subunit Sec63